MRAFGLPRNRSCTSTPGSTSDRALCRVSGPLAGARPASRLVGAAHIGRDVVSGVRFPCDVVGGARLRSDDFRCACHREVLSGTRFGGGRVHGNDDAFETVRLWVFVSRCSSVGVRLRRRIGRRPASGSDFALRLGFRGRGVHRFALDPPSSTCQKKHRAGQPRRDGGRDRRRSGGKRDGNEHEHEDYGVANWRERAVREGAGREGGGGRGGIGGGRRGGERLGVVVGRVSEARGARPLMRRRDRGVGRVRSGLGVRARASSALRGARRGARTRWPRGRSVGAIGVRCRPRLAPAWVICRRSVWWLASGQIRVACLFSGRDACTRPRCPSTAPSSPETRVSGCCLPAMSRSARLGGSPASAGRA